MSNPEVDSGNKFYFSSNSITIQASSSAYIGITTGQLAVELDDFFLLTDSQEVIAYLYENENFTLGVDSRVINRNRILEQPKSFISKTGVTPDNALNPADAVALVAAAGAKNAINSADNSSRPPWLLDFNTSYIIELANGENQIRNAVLAAEVFQRVWIN